MSTATPPPLPTQQTQQENRFRLRQWWRNGAAGKFTVVFAILALLNLFQPWAPDYRGAGYSETHIEGNYNVRRWYSGTTALGSGTAFSVGQGWVPFICLVGTLFVCGRPRQMLGGSRWVPLCAGIIVFACSFDELQRLQREAEAWLAKFGTRPVVTMPAAIQWVIIFSACLIISGAFFARRRGEPAKSLAGAA